MQNYIITFYSEASEETYAENHEFIVNFCVVFDETHIYHLMGHAQNLMFYWGPVGYGANIDYKHSNFDQINRSFKYTLGNSKIFCF